MVSDATVSITGVGITLNDAKGSDAKMIKRHPLGTSAGQKEAG